MRRNLALVIDSSGTSQTHDYSLDAILRGMGRFTAVEDSHLVDWSVFHPSQHELRQARYAKAAALLGSWLSDTSTYDEKVGNALEKESGDPIKFGTGDE